MQLFVIDWIFQNSEDQLFATNEFCQYLKEGRLNENVDGFELKFIAHTPQTGSGVIICKANTTSVLFRILKMWRENFNIEFNIRPALTSEELISLNTGNQFWSREQMQA